MRRKVGGSAATPHHFLPHHAKTSKRLLTWPKSKEYVTIPNYLDFVRNTYADLIAVMSREFHDSTRKKAASAMATT